MAEIQLIQFVEHSGLRHLVGGLGNETVEALVYQRVSRQVKFDELGASPEQAGKLQIAEAICLKVEILKVEEIPENRVFQVLEIVI